MEVLLSALPAHIQTASVPLSNMPAREQPQLPPELSALPKGSVVEGFVINRDRAGNPILRTSQGVDVLVKSELFLKTGSQVIVRLAASAQAHQLTAKIINVDGQPISQLTQQQPALGHSQQPAARDNTANTPTPLQAVLLKPASLGGAGQAQHIAASILRVPIAQLPTIAQGASLSFQLAAPLTAAQSTPLSTPVATTPTATHSPAAQYGAYQKQAAAPPSPAIVPASSPPSPAGQPVAATPPTAPALTASVIGHEGSASILKTPIGTIKLFTPAPLPTGSSVPLHYVPQTQPAQHTLPAQTASPIASSLAHDWESLREAMQLLAPNDASKAAPQADIASRIPNTKSQLVNSVLFFLSALKGSELQRWLGGSNTQKLDAKSPNLLQRLSGDFSTISSMLARSEGPDTPWQMLAFPLMHEDALHQARLFWRHEQGQQSQEGQEETRFVFDLQLSQLGALQIDGLVHGKRPSCRCDLLIRSETPLSGEEQTELSTLYVQASQAAGIKGALRFVAGKQHLLNPLQELHEAAAGAGDDSILA